MADIKTKESRSYNMSRIAGKDTKPEELVRKYLFSKGFRYRKNVRKLPGTRLGASEVSDGNLCKWLFLAWT